MERQRMQSILPCMICSESEKGGLSAYRLLTKPRKPGLCRVPPYKTLLLCAVRTIKTGIASSNIATMIR